MSLRADAEPGASARFPRSRRLKRRRLIRPLFQRRASDVGRVRVGVVRVLYRVVPREATGLDTPLQAGFAPGRTRTKVIRNRIRRAMREAFRNHQDDLLALFADRPDALTLFVLFQGREETAAADVRRDLPRALDRVAERVATARPATP